MLANESSQKNNVHIQLKNADLTIDNMAIAGIAGIVQSLSIAFILKVFALVIYRQRPCNWQPGIRDSWKKALIIGHIRIVAPCRVEERILYTLDRLSGKRKIDSIHSN